MIKERQEARIEELIEPCKSCQHKGLKNGNSIITAHVKFWVCGCQCGRATLNGNHPLSPCKSHNGDCINQSEEGIYDCYEDEYAIIEGNRCHYYVAWLRAMREFNGYNYKYPEMFSNPIIPHDENED